MIKTWITAYDVFSARIAENSGIDTILVGDSLGMTVYGDKDTTQVTKEIMLRHFVAVKKGAPHTRIVLDFPYNSAKNLETALKTAEYFSHSGANIFKIEGDASEKNLEIFSALIQKGYQIVGHLGLQPQKFLTSDWTVKGREKSEAENIKNSVQKFLDIGITEIVLECVPEILATEIQKKYSGKADIIGIGAGRGVHAQILVFDDVVGRTDSSKFSPKFVQKFGEAEKTESQAVQDYISFVQTKKFPAEKHIFR